MIKIHMQRGWRNNIINQTERFPNLPPCFQSGYWEAWPPLPHPPCKTRAHSLRPLCKWHSHHFCLVSTGLMYVMPNVLISAGSSASPGWLCFRLGKNKMSGVLLLWHHSATPYFNSVLSWQKHSINPALQSSSAYPSDVPVAGRIHCIHRQRDIRVTQICPLITPSECLLGPFLSLYLPAVIFLSKYFLWYFHPKDLQV